MSDENCERTKADEQGGSISNSNGSGAVVGDAPTNKVRLSSGGRFSFVVDECVICGEEHRHGSRDPTVILGGRSVKTAHCPDENESATVYYIQLADDEELPEHWVKIALSDAAANVAGRPTAEVLA